MEKPIDQLIEVNFQKKNWEEIIHLLDSSNIKNNSELLGRGNLILQKIREGLEQKFTSRSVFVTLPKKDWEILNKIVDSECKNRNKDWSNWGSFITNQINTNILETARKASINELVEKRKLVTRHVAKMSSDYMGDLSLKNLTKLMLLEVNYYSKDKVSIQMHFHPIDTYDDRSELFLFACHTLRQFSNVGKNMVGEAFAGLFLKNEKIDEKLEEWEGVDSFIGIPSRYKAEDLLLETFKLKLHLSGLDDKEIQRQSWKALFDLKINSNVKKIDEDYFQKLPQLTNYDGPGAKQFTMTWSPLELEWMGFKRLTFDWGYYGLHAVIAFYRILANRHWDDIDFRIHLKMIALECAILYVLNNIPKDQAECAKIILAKYST